MESYVDRPPEMVFAQFTNFAEAANHVDAITRVEMLTDGPVGLGTRFRETRMMFGKEATEEMEITAFEQNRLYTLGCESCGCEHAYTFRFEPERGGTRVRVEAEMKALNIGAKIVMPLMNLFMGGTIKQCLRDDLVQMKAVAEAQDRICPAV